MNTSLENSEVGKNNLTPENQAILLQEQSVSDIATILGISHQTVSSILKRMKRQSDFIDRETDHGKRFVTLTSQGVEKILTLLPSKNNK